MRNISSVACLVVLSVAVSANHVYTTPMKARLRSARLTGELGILCKEDFINKWLDVCHRGNYGQRLTSAGRRNSPGIIGTNFIIEYLRRFLTGIYHLSFTNKFQNVYLAAMSVETPTGHQPQVSYPFHRPHFGHLRRRKRSLQTPSVQHASPRISERTRVGFVAMMCCQEGCNIRHIRALCHWSYQTPTTWASCRSATVICKHVWQV